MEQGKVVSKFLLLRINSSNECTHSFCLFLLLPGETDQKDSPSKRPKTVTFDSRPSIEAASSLDESFETGTIVSETSTVVCPKKLDPPFQNRRKVFLILTTLQSCLQGLIWAIWRNLLQKRQQQLIIFCCHLTSTKSTFGRTIRWTTNAVSRFILDLVH